MSKIEFIIYHDIYHFILTIIYIYIKRLWFHRALAPYGFESNADVGDMDDTQLFVIFAASICGVTKGAVYSSL